MTSFTAASGPLDNMRQATERIEAVRESLRTLLTRNAGVDAKVEDAAVDALVCVAISLVDLEDAAERLRELENLIVGREKEAD